MHHNFFFGESSGRSDQEFLQLACPLLVAPISDPDQVNLPWAIERHEGVHIGSLMKGPGAVYAEAIDVNTAYGLAKRKHAIEQMQMKLQHLTCLGVRAVMAVVQQGNKPEFLFERQDTIDHQGMVPFVQQDNIHLPQLFFEKA